MTASRPLGPLRILQLPGKPAPRLESRREYEPLVDGALQRAALLPVVGAVLVGTGAAAGPELGARSGA